MDWLGTTEVQANKFEYEESKEVFKDSLKEEVVDTEEQLTSPEIENKSVKEKIELFEKKHVSEKEERQACFENSESNLQPEVQKYDTGEKTNDSELSNTESPAFQTVDANSEGNKADLNLSEKPSYVLDLEQSDNLSASVDERESLASKQIDESPLNDIKYTTLTDPSTPALLREKVEIIEEVVSHMEKNFKNREEYKEQKSESQSTFKSEMKVVESREENISYDYRSECTEDMSETTQDVSDIKSELLESLESDVSLNICKDNAFTEQNNFEVEGQSLAKEKTPTLSSVYSAEETNSVQEHLSNLVIAPGFHPGNFIEEDVNSLTATVGSDNGTCDEEDLERAMFSREISDERASNEKDQDDEDDKDINDQKININGEFEKESCDERSYNIISQENIEVNHDIGLNSQETAIQQNQTAEASFPEEASGSNFQDNETSEKEVKEDIFSESKVLQNQAGIASVPDEDEQEIEECKEEVKEDIFFESNVLQNQAGIASIPDEDEKEIEEAEEEVFYESKVIQNEASLSSFQKEYLEMEETDSRNTEEEYFYESKFEQTEKDLVGLPDEEAGEIADGEENPEHRYPLDSVLTSGEFSDRFDGIEPAEKDLAEFEIIEKAIEIGLINCQSLEDKDLTYSSISSENINLENKTTAGEMEIEREISSEGQVEYHDLVTEHMTEESQVRPSEYDLQVDNLPNVPVHSPCLSPDEKSKERDGYFLPEFRGEESDEMRSSFDQDLDQEMDEQDLDQEMDEQDQLTLALMSKCSQSSNDENEEDDLEQQQIHISRQLQKQMNEDSNLFVNESPLEIITERSPDSDTFVDEQDGNSLLKEKGDGQQMMLEEQDIEENSVSEVDTELSLKETSKEGVSDDVKEEIEDEIEAAFDKYENEPELTIPIDAKVGEVVEFDIDIDEAFDKYENLPEMSVPINAKVEKVDENEVEVKDENQESNEIIEHKEEIQSFPTDESIESLEDELNKLKREEEELDKQLQALSRAEKEENIPQEECNDMISSNETDDLGPLEDKNDAINQEKPSVEVSKDDVPQSGSHFLAELQALEKQQLMEDVQSEDDLIDDDYNEDEDIGDLNKSVDRIEEYITEEREKSQSKEMVGSVDRVEEFTFEERPADVQKEIIEHETEDTALSNDFVDRTEHFMKIIPNVIYNDTEDKDKPPTDQTNEKDYDNVDNFPPSYKDMGSPDDSPSPPPPSGKCESPVDQTFHLSPSGDISDLHKTATVTPIFSEDCHQEELLIIDDIGQHTESQDSDKRDIFVTPSSNFMNSSLEYTSQSSVDFFQSAQSGETTGTGDYFTAPSDTLSRSDYTTPSDGMSSSAQSETMTASECTMTGSEYDREGDEADEEESDGHFSADISQQIFIERMVMAKTRHDETDTSSEGELDDIDNQSDRPPSPSEFTLIASHDQEGMHHLLGLNSGTSSLTSLTTETSQTVSNKTLSEVNQCDALSKENLSDSDTSYFRRQLHSNDEEKESTDDKQSVDDAASDRPPSPSDFTLVASQDQESLNRLLGLDDELTSTQNNEQGRLTHVLS